MPEAWAHTCPDEIRQGLAGVNAPYWIEPGTSPALRLAAPDTTFPVAGIEKISRDSHDAAVDLWKITIETRSDAYTLWFADLRKADEAYKDLGHALRGTPQSLAADKDPWALPRDRR